MRGRTSAIQGCGSTLFNLGVTISFHAVSTAAAGLFGGFNRWRRAAGGSFVDDDLTQVLDAVLGEGGHAILTHAVDPEAAFREHVDRQLVQPVFVLTEQVGDVADREDGCYRATIRLPDFAVPNAAASSTAVAGRYCGRDDRRSGPGHRPTKPAGRRCSIWQ